MCVCGTDREDPHSICECVCVFHCVSVARAEQGVRSLDRDMSYWLSCKLDMNYYLYYYYLYEFYFNVFNLRFGVLFSLLIE